MLDSDFLELRKAEVQRRVRRVEHLFGVISHPKTGEPYTNAEVARMSAGDLTEDEVEGIRSGSIEDPTVGQVVAPDSFLTAF